MAFPMVAASVVEGIGVVYALLFFLGLLFALPVWQQLCKEEKAILLGFVVFALCAGVSLVNTEHLRVGISKFERYSYFISAIPVYLLLRRFGEACAKALLVGCIVTGIAHGVYAWYLASVLGQSDVPGGYGKLVFGDISMFIAAILGVAVVTLRLSFRMRMLIVLAMVLSLSATILSMARGAWLFIPIFVVVVLGFSFSQMSRRRWIVSGILILCVAGLVGVIESGRIKAGIEGGLADIDRTLVDPSQFSSWGERLLMWRDAVTIWKTSPLFGTGIGDFEFDRERLKETGQSVFPAIYDHAHSIYFDALATTGIVGLVAMLVFAFGLPLKAFIRNRQSDAPYGWFVPLAGIVVVLVFATFGLSQGWFSRNVIVKPYLLALLVFLAAKFELASRANKAP